MFRFFIRRISVNRPAPHPLPPNDQREFEVLLRSAQTPPSPQNINALHPDARPPLEPEFRGEVNPSTGERGGPKREPVKRWAADPGGDWSLNGRVTDF